MSNPAPRFRDVRMRGFAERADLQTVRVWIDQQTGIGLDVETISAGDAAGRVLAVEVRAAIDVPAFDRSAMDGYAVQGAATVGAGAYSPLTLTVAGTSWPGRPFSGRIGPGESVRIMTGAPVPDGADAVLPAEYADEADGRIQIVAAVAPGKNVGRAGEDVRAGAVVLPAGRRLRPQDLGLLAAAGVAGLCVLRRPRVRLVITGNELIPAGEPLSPYCIYDANTPMLRALAERDGAEVESVRMVADDPDAIRSAMTEPGADVLLISGGSSVGAEDHAPQLLAEVGELVIHGVAMRPAAPAGMGQVGDRLVFLLPGNPVSCLCAYDFFAGRAIRRLSGRPGEWPYRSREVPVAQKIVSAVGRVDYCRVRVTPSGVEPISTSGASILSSTTRADGFVVVPAECEGYAPGTSVRVWQYDDLPAEAAAP